MVKRQLPKIVYFILFAVIVGILLFNNNGVVKYFQLNSELENLRTNIRHANSEIQKLDSQIDSLKNSAVKIEQVAREKYRMKYGNEIPIRVKTE